MKSPSVGDQNMQVVSDKRKERSSAVEIIRSRLQLDLLTRARIVLIGLGGIGSILAHYLVHFLASMKDEFRCLLVDGDAYSPENAYRVAIPDLRNKAEAQMYVLNAQFERPGLHLRHYPHYLTEENQRQVIQQNDFVLLACDNHATRRLASRRLSELHNGVLISGGNDGVGPNERGSYGNIQIYGRANGRDAFGAPLDQFHPEIREPADRNPEQLDCIELAAAGVPQMLFVNLAVASAMCGAVWRLLMPPEGERMYDEACFDVLDAVSTPQWLTGTKNQMPSSRP